MIYAALFYLIAGLTILCALGVALSQNVVYSAFALMGTLIGAAGIYAFLAADFLAVVQVLVYVGGIMVLTLFAIMLTHQISDINVSNRSVGWIPAGFLVLATGGGEGLCHYGRGLVHRSSAGVGPDNVSDRRGLSRGLSPAIRARVLMWPRHHGAFLTQGRSVCGVLLRVDEKT